MNNSTACVAPTVSVSDRVFRIAAEHTEQPREMLDRETALGEYLDSLGTVEMIMELEDEFELSIPEDQAQEIKTIGQAIDAVESRVRARAGAASDANSPASP